MKFVIFLCVIGTILGDETTKNDVEVTTKTPVTEPTVSDEPEKDAIVSMETALTSFDKIFKQFAPWKDFHQQMQSQQRVKHAYTSRSGVLAGQIMGSLLSIDTQYFQATRPLYGFCGESMGLLDGYKLILGVGPEGQQELLEQVLQKDVDQSKLSLERLKHTFSILNEASDKLNTLVLQLHDDFADGSQYYKDEIKAAELEAKNNMSAKQIIKQVIKRSIESLKLIVPELTIVEQLLIATDGKKPDPAAKLKAEFASIFDFCKKLWTSLEAEATIDFDKIENELKGKIEAVEAMKKQITTNGIPSKGPTLPIVSAISSLNQKCTAYQSTYGTDII